MPRKMNNSLEAMRSSFFWGGSKDKRKIAWVKWGSVLAAHENGGLGFGSMEAMNHALLYRWRWRALNNPSSLWVRVLVAIHGEECFLKLTTKSKGLWHNITQVVSDIHKLPFSSQELINRQMGNGKDTRLWKDIWCGNSTLASSFPRLFALDVDKNCNIQSRREHDNWKWDWRRELRNDREEQSLQQMILRLPNRFDNDKDDSWRWCLNGNSDFSIAKLRMSIDKARLPRNNNIPTIWNKLVPKKINVFIWRLRRQCLPTNINLFAKGVDVASVNCRLCHNGTEFMEHIFNNCVVNEELRKRLADWIFG